MEGHRCGGSRGRPWGGVPERQWRHCLGLCKGLPEGFHPDPGLWPHSWHWRLPGTPGSQVHNYSTDGVDAEILGSVAKLQDL